MKLKISIWMVLLTILLGLVACGKQEEDSEMPALEEAPAPWHCQKALYQVRTSSAAI